MHKKHGRENDSVEVTPSVEKSEIALREEAIQAFWQEQDIFNKSIETPAGEKPKGDYVFYDGPPFATGLPHYGHILASTIKDAVPRFWTMNGYRVRRKWGWDCHGLPLENIIEKRLGLATKRDIETYGVKNFNEAAREAVLEYADDWRRIIPRMGRWADMDNDYKTMDASYTESVWWVFQSLHKKGLIYEGFKVMHLCSRCGTTLSNFEVNLGYKDIKDIAVTVKLPLLDEKGEVTDESLLVWTTTPWTLPGNLAAAVHNDFTYAKVKVETEEGAEVLILAKERLAQLDGVEYELVGEVKGSELVGRSYQPPFSFLAEQLKEGKEQSFKIHHADYVEIGEEGTGAVHIAPAYGEDDMNLAKEHGVPIVHHVDSDGHFMPWVEGFERRLVKPKDDEAAGVLHLDADIEVVKALKEKGSLLKKENITHSYPHCWRCDTPLLNYATTSWFVEVTKISDQLVAENGKVHWVPEHVGKNRFGKWLEGARDWAVSRQRYWGAPLPIWRNAETKEIKVFGSRKELQAYVPKSGNRYFVMRHGESEKNTQNIATGAVDAPYPLTEKGKEETRTAALSIDADIDVVICSPVLRAVQTAELVVETLGLPKEALVFDERVREVNHGILEGKTLDEYREQYPDGIERFTKDLEGFENWSMVKRRMGEFMFAVEQEYLGKNILIISHGDPLYMLGAAAQGLTNEETVAAKKVLDPKTGAVRELDFTPYPHNDNFELDFHRPYIDDFVLEEDGVRLERVPDVFDCWFESGSMPYGQHHYPFTCDEEMFSERFPANFIAEGLDQTRGWFYSLIVLGTALFGKSPFQNVIVNGLVLAEDGKKMSKSLQNYPDPMELAARTGVDAMRLYMLQSPIMRGEDLNFSEKEVLELQRKNIGRLHNVLALYEQAKEGSVESRSDSTHVLDRWILARLSQLVTETTEGYKNYELDKASRPLGGFIDDLSVWYLRRSRDRFKSDEIAEKQAALSMLRHVLQTVSKVMAPAMPFYAEYLWRELREESEAESVHLSSWPEVAAPDSVVLGEMDIVREVVTAALEQRAKANIKVRQPLPALTLNIELAPEYVAQVADEVNVKEVRFDEAAADRVALDTSLTPELLAEGAVRELMRAVQGARKDMQLVPSDGVVLTLGTDTLGKAAVEAHLELVQKTVGATAIEFAPVTEGVEVTTGEYRFIFTVEKEG